MTMPKQAEDKYAARLAEELRSGQEDLRQIQGDIDALARDERQEGTAPTNHMADEGSNVYERERLLTIRMELEERVQLVQAAQERLASGTYGKCQRCGQPIAEARLEALPFAMYCIECQEIVDQEQTVTGVKSSQMMTS
jgi:DnaK suppressor protein